MAGKGESKTIATTPAMTPPATLPAINTPTPATEASMEDVVTFVQPLAMIHAWRIGISRTSLRRGRSRWKSFGMTYVFCGEG